MSIQISEGPVWSEAAFFTGSVLKVSQNIRLDMKQSQVLNKN